MIWLTWHRQRKLLFLFAVLTAGLALWMYLVGHSFEMQAGKHCGFKSPECNAVNGSFPLDRQAAVIDILALFLPCLMGMVFGAPLVASELEHSTNRLAWTQSVSRTRWLLTKWVVVLAPLLLLVLILTLVSQWWTGRVFLEFYRGSDADLGPDAAVLLRDHRPRADRLHGLRLLARRCPRFCDPEDVVGRRGHGRRLRTGSAFHGVRGRSHLAPQSVAQIGYGSSAPSVFVGPRLRLPLHAGLGTAVGCPVGQRGR